METKDKWELTLKTLALVGGAIAGVFAYFKYSDTKTKEFYTSYWNTKAALYRDITDVAGTLATTPSKEKFEELKARYWALAFGPLTLVESKGLEKEIAAFGDLVDKQSVQDLPAYQLEPHANDLSGALKDDLIKSWRTPFSEFLYRDDEKAPATVRKK
jgi:hypothetical protein